MSEQVIHKQIMRLIVARMQSHGDVAKQTQINAMLDKLYEANYERLSTASKETQEC